VPTVRKLIKEPYASVLCYPKSSKTETRKRLEELQKLRVTAIEFVGEKEVLNVPVLGKGCVGLVVLAYRNGAQVALKIRRMDADRKMMQQEADLLRRANSVGVGPRLLDVSRNFLSMQFIDGVLLPDWLEISRGKMRIKSVLREVLEQCWCLDRVGLDHGELSHAPKHVIVDKEGKPFIVDFESASVDRRPSNVTSICQFLFIGSETARKVVARLGEIDRNAVVEALRCYKNEGTRDSFCRVLSTCGL